MSKNLTNIDKQWQIISANLKAWELRLIEMRNDGLGYPEISATLRKEFKIKGNDFSLVNLRTCLMLGGRLRIEFETYGSMTAMESLEAGRRLRQNSHLAAVATNVGLLRAKTEAVRLSAAKDIQDRNEGKAVQQVEVRDGSEIEAMKQKLKGLFDDDEDTTKNSGKPRKTGKRKSKGEKTAKPISSRGKASR
jgi:hypothetical protein